MNDKSTEEKLQEVIQQARENQQRQERLQKAELDLLQSDSLPELFTYLFTEYVDNFRLQGVSLLLLDTEHEVRRLFRDNGESLEKFGTLQLLTEKGDAARIDGLGIDPVLEAYAEERHAWLLPNIKATPASVAILPLVRRGESMGVVTCTSDDPARFDPSYGTELVQRLASILAISIENAISYHRLHFMGLTDALTGARNRRFLDNRLPEEVEHSQGSGAPLSFLFLDIDHFKKVNDNYGHQTGDEVLRVVSARTNYHMRNSDILARYGGEEFAVLLPDTNIDMARQIAERIRASIEDQPVKVGEDILSITTSIGVSSMANVPAGISREQAAESLTQTADTALYQAKENGRNQVVCFSPQE